MSLVQVERKTSSFHIHLDGAVLPETLENYAKQKYGFYNDDFDHHLIVDSDVDHDQETLPLPARQLTLKIEDRHSGKDVRRICEDISAKAQTTGFAGLIQSEFVMTEVILRSKYVDFQPVPFPFYIQMRKISPKQDEAFKSHELHLEFPIGAVDHRLIAEIASSGMSVVFSSKEVTFTVSGNLNEIRKTQDGLISYLKQTSGFDRANLVVEATVFHSLHRMKPENTPLIVEKINERFPDMLLPHPMPKEAGQVSTPCPTTG